MNSPAHDLATFVAGSGSLAALHSSGQWAVHVGSEPESPEDVVTLYDAGGAGPDTDELDEFVSRVQVRVRSRNYIQGFDRQRDIQMEILDVPLDSSTSVFTVVDVTSDIACIGRDDNNRHIWVATYECRRYEKET